MLEDEPFGAFKPIVESLIADKDQNKQRAAAEFLAGILGGQLSIISCEKIVELQQGSKHWPTDKQDALWTWFIPHMTTIFRQNIKTDTLAIWASFLEVYFYISNYFIPALIDLCSTYFITKTLVGCSL
jgi:proteasome activator subunit 4